MKVDPWLRPPAQGNRDTDGPFFALPDCKGFEFWLQWTPACPFCLSIYCSWCSNALRVPAPSEKYGWTCCMLYHPVRHSWKCCKMMKNMNLTSICSSAETSMRSTRRQNILAFLHFLRFSQSILGLCKPEGQISSCRIKMLLLGVFSSTFWSLNLQMAFRNKKAA